MDGLKYGGSSTYQIEGVAEGVQMLVIDPGNNWTSTVPKFGILPPGGGAHLGGAPERITLEHTTEGCVQP